MKYYHNKYPSHGYRWIKTKIAIDTGEFYTDNYIYKCFKYLNIHSENRHKVKYRRKKTDTYKYANLIKGAWDITKPMQVVVTDMTAFWCQATYYELTLYVDVFNNEIVGYSLKDKKGCRDGYFDGLQSVIEKLKEQTDPRLILHSDQGSVYSSKAYNELIGKYSITHSMSRPGTPTDNPVFEAINGWLKDELFINFKIRNATDVEECVREYIHFFNYERPASSLGYLTPVQYKNENYFQKLSTLT